MAWEEPREQARRFSLFSELRAGERNGRRSRGRGRSNPSGQLGEGNFQEDGDTHSRYLRVL